TRCHGIRLAREHLGRAGPGEVRDQTTLLREVGSAERDCGGCGVEECHVRERTAVPKTPALAETYNLRREFATLYMREDAPCARPSSRHCAPCCVAAISDSHSSPARPSWRTGLSTVPCA